MNTAMKDLGIDRMTVAERVELALGIWESLEGEAPPAVLSPGDEVELERRDQEMEGNPLPGETWKDIRVRIEADH